MNVKELKHYCAKRIEIDILDFQIREAYPSEIVSDVVVGKYGQPYPIKGYGSNLVPSLSRRKAKLMEECNRIEQFIESIDDSLIRMIVSLKYINGLNWKQVAYSIGGNNTENSVRMASKRFFEKQ